MHFTIRVEWRRQDGTTATEELVTQNQDACKSAGDVGLPLAEAKRIVAWVQGIVVNEQVEQYCETARRCPTCGEYRPLKDNRQRRFYTVLGKLTVKAPRFEGCRACKDRPCVSPVSDLLRDRVSPELSVAGSAGNLARIFRTPTTSDLSRVAVNRVHSIRWTWLVIS
jgi:hypothetical protein